MPKANPKINWHALKMMFATGKSTTEIATAMHIPLGTVCARSARDGWMKDREAVQAVAIEATRQAQEVLMLHSERGKVWPTRVGAVAEKGLAVLEREEPTTLSQVDRLASVLDKVDKVGRRSHGLDEDSAKGNTIVNLGFLAGYTDDPLVKTIPALDVSSA